ncbi:hypothetical protein [Heyndrickxia oleronia]|nr:hypothetical protein [Heyndrickxia oleronia]
MFQFTEQRAAISITARPLFGVRAGRWAFTKATNYKETALVKKMT